MKKHLILILIGLSLSVNTFGQEQEYENLIRQGDSTYFLNNYNKATEFFQRAFKLKKDNPNHLYNGACSAALSGDKKNAFEFLELAFQNGYTNITHLKNDTDLNNLHNEKEWAELLVKMQKKVDEIERDYDKPLQAELLSIYNDDQSIRMEYMNAVNKFGYKNSKVDSLAKKMIYQDSINLIKVTKILDEKGWVGSNKIGGQANQTLFLVIQHSDLKTQEKYLPIMRDAVKKGNASIKALALLEDRIALGQGKKQKYGSQIWRNEKTNEYYVAPLEDPDNVDERRHEVGLNSLSEYAKQWNINWNVEEYKKQLQEIENSNKK